MIGCCFGRWCWCCLVEVTQMATKSLLKTHMATIHDPLLYVTENDAVRSNMTLMVMAMVM